MNFKMIIAALVLFASFHSFAEEKKYIICKFKTEVRTLEIAPGGPENGCEALYSKYGKTERVGWGKNTTGCTQIVENIKKNLEESDWNCKDKTELRVSAQ